MVSGNEGGPDATIEGARRNAGAHPHAILLVDDEPAILESLELTLGSDYTLAWGNGLTVLLEHLITGLSEQAFSEIDSNVTGTMMSYPVGLLDRVSAIISYDWDNRDWYRTLTWDRQYDRWRFVALGFWNPDDVTGLSQAAGTSSVFAGLGLQLQGVYNH